MTKRKFSELVEKHREDRRARLVDVQRWAELEEQSLQDDFYLSRDEILEKNILYHKLFYKEK